MQSNMKSTPRISKITVLVCTVTLVQVVLLTLKLASYAFLCVPNIGPVPLMGTSWWFVMSPTIFINVLLLAYIAYTLATDKHEEERIDTL